MPRLAVPATVASGSLADYMGLPPGTYTNATYDRVVSLPFRCYNIIFNSWFRDENLQDSVVVDTDDGTDALTDYVLLRRG